MDIKDSYLHGTVGVVKSISVDADKLSYKLADIANTTNTITLPLVTQSANGLMSKEDKTKLDQTTGMTQAIPYIVGPSTDTTAGTWTGTYQGITSYTEGLTIIYVPKVAGGSSTTTLNINGLGAKTCYYSGTGKLTTHFAAGTPIMFTYTNGGWTRADYNSNTTYSVVSSSANGLAPKVISTNTDTVGSAYYVLASTNGSTTPSWYKLPSTAYYYRPISVNDTSILGSNNTALNLKNGINIDITNSSGNVTIAAPNITPVNQAIPYIVGGEDTTAGTWTGSYSGITEYSEGLTIIYVPTVAGASTTTLNINNLGSKTCYYTGTSKLTTHYAVGTPILLTYSGGGWKRADYDSDNNTYTSAWCITAAATAAKTASCTYYTLKANSYVHILIRYANTVAGAITMNINSQGAKPIYINGTASSASNYTLPAGTYIAFYDGTNYYFRTDGILPGTIEKANSATSANKVANSLTLKINTGTTEGTSLYTYDGSSAKTLDIKSGTGIGFTNNTAGVLSIYNSGVRSIATGTTNGTISVNTNGTSANVAVKGLGSAAYTASTDYAIRKTLSNEDLDTIVIPGFYNAGGGNTCTNKPSGVEHFGMEVIHCASGTYYVQILFEESYSNLVWRRHCINGTWSNWTQDKLTDTTYGVVSSSANGLAPKVINTNTDTIGSAYYVLASTNGSATPSWYKLPANAFANDDTKVTQTNTTTSASYRVLFSGNANNTTETTTARKSDNLLFNPSTGNLTTTSLKLNGDIVINDGTNKDRYIKWQYNNTDEYSWRIGYLGSGGANNNFLVFDSYRSTEGWATALKFEHNTMIAHFGATVNAPTFQGNLDGTYINKLTNYIKATSAADLAATDTLNTALGKLEYKAATAYDWIISVTTEDTDKLVNKWGEIVDFLDSVAEGTDITDEFVTRKTAQTITGAKTFNSDVTLYVSTGDSPNLVFQRGDLGTDDTVDWKMGVTSGIFKLRYSATSTNSGAWTDVISVSTYSNSNITTPYKITANKFITSGGTSSQFVKGDGSLDSNKYLINTHDTHTSAYYRTTNVNGTNYAFWSHTTSAAFTIYAPTTVGTQGQVLTSNGSGAPIWSNSVGVANNGIFYIEGTGTTAGTWLGSHTGITSYYTGLTIAYKIPIAGASTTTLNINSLGAKTCYINTTKLTTHYGVGSVAILVYDGTYFRAADYWDGNSYAYVRQYTTDSTAAEYPLLFRYNTAAPTSNGYVTEYTRYDSGITINPSTNTITATTFNGTATNSDKLDDLHAADLLTSVTSTASKNISVTVGGTTKSVTDAYAKFGVGVYTSSGGEQRPSYIGSGLVRWNMMRNTTTYYDSQLFTGYCDWMMMDTYTGTDVPYVTMIGVLKASTPHAYIASGAKGSTDGKWTIKALLDSNNYTSYTPILNSESTHATKTSVIYAPTTAGTTGQVLTSSGSGAPSWVNSTSLTVGTSQNGVYFIEGTGTTAGTWLGDHAGIASYYKGLTIAYKIPIAGASTTTLNINSLGAITCYINTSKLTTHYGVGATILLVYDGTYFRATDYWDSTNTYSDCMCATAAATAAKTATSTYYALRTGNLFICTVRYTNTSAGAITLNINSTGAKPIYLNGSATSSSNYNLVAGKYLVYYDGTNYYFYDTGAKIPYLYSVDGYFTGDIVIQSVGELDKFMYFSYDADKTAGASWRLGMLGSGSGDTNYFAVQSGTASTGATTWNNAIRIGQNTFDVALGGNLYPLTNNTKTCGTSSYRWSNVYSVAGNFSGTITLAGTSSDTARLVFSRSGDATWNYINWPGNTSTDCKLAFGYSNSSGACYYYMTSQNFNPVADNARDLGASSIRWKNVYSVAFTGNLTGNVTGNVSGSSGSCTGNAATATTLKPTTIVSSKALNLSNLSWTDTGYTFASLTTGTYAVQVTSGSNLVASGIMSVYKNLSDTAGDEIPLHVYGTAGWRPYLRTYANKLQISSNDASATSRTVTIKIAQIL